MTETLTFLKPSDLVKDGILTWTPQVYIKGRPARFLITYREDREDYIVAYSRMAKVLGYPKELQEACDLINAFVTAANANSSILAGAHHA